MEFAVYAISIRGIFNKHYEIHLDDVLVYRVRRPSFFKFSEMIFCDPGGNEILKIKKHFAFFEKKFVFTKNEKAIATFEKKSIENFYNSSSIYGKHTVEGNFFNSEYTVFNDEGEIAKISRKRFRSTNKYGVAIIKGHNELYVLAMIVAISMVIAAKKNKG
jgi:uncharacterized protein YxjI